MALIDTKTIDGTMYYITAAEDGWPTGPCGPCGSVAAALERVAAYERLDEVSEAAPGQASRAQMTAFLVWARSAGIRDGGAMLQSIEEARRDGLHSDAWIRASRHLVEMKPATVLRAGGAKIRRV
jgi:hypothetical protein